MMMNDDGDVDGDGDDDDDDDECSIIIITITSSPSSFSSQSSLPDQSAVRSGREHVCFNKQQFLQFRKNDGDGDEFSNNNSCVVQQRPVRELFPHGFTVHHHAQIIRVCDSHPRKRDERQKVERV